MIAPGQLFIQLFIGPKTNKDFHDDYMIPVGQTEILSRFTRFSVIL